ncbi:hypothetical protein AB205_0159530, partial [Aquarana catesbeiana]
MDEGSQGRLCCLDNNHTHFILVDDGTHGCYGVEIPLRTRLEKFISEQTMHKEGTAIKTVCVVLEGGPGTLDIQDIVRMESLLTILREEKVGDQRMDVAILQALLKASHNANHNGQENWDHQLKLAVSWNRPEIAETQIFTEDWMWKPSDLYPSLTLSLIEDKPSFVRLFLERGVSLAEYLTWDTLTELYNNTDPSSLIHSKLERQAKAERSKEVTKIELHHVSCVLQDLLGDVTELLYPEAKPKHTWSLAEISIK